MPNKNRYERQFFAALQDIFVGAKVEGDSGFVNLMRIKARYYEQGVFPHLKADIDTALIPFPDFREELFDKLYTFFSRYFSESGSIYFRHTPNHQNIYEKVYTDDRDVMLFWKTHMLYYVKTDRIFTSLRVEVDDLVFFFDAGQMTLKRANEKREVIYSFLQKAQDGSLHFSVEYSERGKTTKVDDILREVKQAGVKLDEDTLTRAFRVFEKQSEVDFFINKNARAFLEEQFDLWMYQYLFAGQNVWRAERLAQLQTLKDVACKIIAFIAQFEDELVRIWNKPKFVRNSHYVITLDKISDETLLDKLLNHPGMAAQIQEWVELGMVESGFDPNFLKEKDLTGEIRQRQYQFLPFDTRYFPDLELKILALFDDLDQALDGWLIHSENYQALSTLSKKYYNKVQCIHIDPPYNTESSGFLYSNKYQHSSWLSMMENRINRSMEFLNLTGCFISHVDEFEIDHLHSYYRSLAFPYLGVIVWDKKNPMMGGKGIANQHEYILWGSFFEGTFSGSSENAKEILQKAKDIIQNNNGVNEVSQKEFINWLKQNPKFSGGEKSYQFLNEDGRVYQSVGMGWPNPNPPPQQFFIPLIHPKTKKPCPIPPRGWSRSPEKMRELIEKNEIIFGDDETIQPRRKIFLTSSTSKPISSIIQNGQKGKAELDNLGLEFSYCHPSSLYEELFFAGLVGNMEGILLDYFAGSGTTAHAIMNLNRMDYGKRKYIMVEMGEHFNTVILPRIKKVAFNSKWKNGKPVFEKNESGMSQFVKYFDLEQYEDTLRRAHYGDADLFHNPYQDPYHQYIFQRDEKMLDALEVDYAANQVHFHPERIYPDIDLAETLSNLRGKWIKRITEDLVEFADGEQISLKDPDWRMLKPLIWW